MIVTQALWFHADNEGTFVFESRDRHLGAIILVVGFVAAALSIFSDLSRWIAYPMFLGFSVFCFVGFRGMNRGNVLKIDPSGNFEYGRRDGKNVKWYKLPVEIVSKSTIELLSWGNKGDQIMIKLPSSETLFLRCSTRPESQICALFEEIKKRLGNPAVT